MNLTNVLLGSTGVLLLVALLLSFGRMNDGREAAPDEVAQLRREIERLEDAGTRLQRESQAKPSLIFPNTYGSPSLPTPTDTASEDTKAAEASEATNEKLAELQAQIRELTEVQRTPPPVIIEEVVMVEEPTPEAPDPGAASRARLIRDAILQANVLEWSPDEWIAIVEPAPRANFGVGAELALRRNDGILCRFTVTRDAGGAFVVALKAGLADGPPEIVPGDELILPPVFDGQLD